MAARDIFHEAVKQALIKDGWTITHDPLFLPFGSIDLYVDLGAEKVIAAERAGRYIAIEVKSFLGSSLVSDFHTALGQFLNYRMVLETREPERHLYLGVPSDTYTTFFTLPFAQLAIQRYQLKLVIYDAEHEEITQWHD